MLASETFKCSLVIERGPRLSVTLRLMETLKGVLWSWCEVTTNLGDVGTNAEINYENNFSYISFAAHAGFWGKR